MFIEEDEFESSFTGFVGKEVEFIFFGGGTGKVEGVGGSDEGGLIGCAFDFPINFESLRGFKPVINFYRDIFLLLGLNIKSQLRLCIRSI